MGSVPPEIIMGEVGFVCGFQAMLAVAWVYSRNPIFYGWSDEVSPLAKLVAQNWFRFPDPTGGAVNLFSRQDLADTRVMRLIAGRPLRALIL